MIGSRYQHADRDAVISVDSSRSRIEGTTYRRLGGKGKASLGVTEPHRSPSGSSGMIRSMKSLGLIIFVVLWSLLKSLVLPVIKIVGLRSFGALIEAVIGFVGGNLEDVVRQDLGARGMTARDSAIRTGSSLRRGLRSTSSYSAKIAGETNIWIFLLAAKSKMAAEDLRRPGCQTPPRSCRLPP